MRKSPLVHLLRSAPKYDASFFGFETIPLHIAIFYQDLPINPKLCKERLSITGQIALEWGDTLKYRNNMELQRAALIVLIMLLFSLNYKCLPFCNVKDI